MATASSWFFFHVFLLLFFSSTGQTTWSSDQDSYVSRESFSFEGDVAWIVQVSDLHISSYYPDRGEDLRKLLAPALRVIRPSLVLITGDLTDAKNKERTATRQDEYEWIQYKKVMNSVIKESDLDERAFFDIRGNHDKYGVPFVRSELDFFSKYSISSQLGRLGTIQSISLMGSNWKYLFLGLDDSMTIGLRGPSNLFGHPTDWRIETVDSELDIWDHQTDARVTKIVFGHFPMSFIASSNNGNRYENIFAKRSVAAYLCGHLHAKLSNQLWRLHTVDSASAFLRHEKLDEFWEWEVGDWKESRLMRILSIDGGEVSFVDIKLGVGSTEGIQTTILITYPTDSRNMNKINSQSKNFRKDISALVFSEKSVLNVTAKILDASRGFTLVEELPLHASGSTHHVPLFRTEWNTSNYKDASGTRFWLQVEVVDIHGMLTSTAPRPFSVDSKLAPLSKTWMAHLIFHIRWEKLFVLLLWSNISFLILLLSLPKLLNHFMERNTLYQRWAMSVSICLPFGQKRIFFWPLWFLIEGSRDRRLWWAMVLYLLYLLKFTWFWGHATSENDAVASMSLRGWTVEVSNYLVQDRIGNPDIMTVILPFMYIILTPLFLLIYCLCAERSAFYLHASKKLCESKEPVPLKMELEPNLQPLDAPLDSSRSMKTSNCKICRGWTRTGILVLCFVFSYLHFRICSVLMGAYGIGILFLSPAVSWIPPLLLVAAVYSTQSQVHVSHVKL
ncbi:putative metallophosphoesterase At3g03305 [Aristolochia californica]|uniref:putative metallophosphoesterase At3g03305 n=1 Tax=Aristolochia californica TaxID=171875 RepID=UPI0035D60B52